MLVSSLLIASVLAAWPMHIIDQSSKGADGVRLNDFNGDGLPDIVTGWEEGGDIRIALNPGVTGAAKSWTTLSAGRVDNPEDAVMVDLDRDGRLDVVSCTEGENRSVYVHWNPGDASSSTWKAEPIPALRGNAQWMFCAPIALEGSTHLVLGAKNENAQLGLIELSGDRSMGNWNWAPMREAGWIMSIVPHDMDDDGDPDILFSDRRGKASGVYWLEQTADRARWPQHEIGLRGREVMFIDAGDVDGDGDTEIAAAVKPRDIYLFLREDKSGTRWKETQITFPDTYGTSKAVKIADIDGDKRADLAVTCEQAEKGSGVFWLSRSESGEWAEHDIAGAPGTKYDLIEMLDLDGDGDLDLLTCEERDINAVLWYENPLQPASGGEKNH